MIECSIITNILCGNAELSTAIINDLLLSAEFWQHFLSARLFWDI